jgi:hypothetical protein
MMMTENHTTIVGVFHDRADAQKAVAALKQAAFTDDQIGVVSPGGDGGKAEAKGTLAAEGALTGAAAGAGVGAVWALGIAAGILPGIGPAVAGGLLASVLASAAGGAIAAGIVGALIGLGIPEEEAKYYEAEFQSGRTIVTVRSARNVEAWDILLHHGAYRRDTGGQARATGAGQAVQVPVEREEVVIERRPATGGAPAADIKAGEEVRIPVKEEQVRVEEVDQKGDAGVRHKGKKS